MTNAPASAKDHIPHLHAVGSADWHGPPEEVRPAWWIRLGQTIGVMVNPSKPSPWNWNPAVITLLIVIGGILVTGGFYVGVQWSNQQLMQKEIDRIAEDEKKRKELEIYNSRKADEKDGHTPEPKQEKKK